MFVQTHEFTHAFLSHLDKTGQRILSAMAGDKPISVQDKTWEEYAADFSGPVLMIKSETREADRDYYSMIFQGAIAGPFVFLRLAQLIGFDKSQNSVITAVLGICHLAKYTSNNAPRQRGRQCEFII